MTAKLLAILISGALFSSHAMAQQYDRHIENDHKKVLIQSVQEPNEAQAPETTTPAAGSENLATAPQNRNGIGPDPDGDTNPATNTRIFSKIGDEAEAAFDPPYQVVTFEAPPGRHLEKIRNQYGDDLGVKFSRGLTRQICEGQRYFQYDSQCTYMRAPSGRFAAAYRDDFSRPLRIRFDQPVCVAAMAIYPTGGKEGERFEVTLQGYDENENALSPAKISFQWTKDTFRWRHMAGAFYPNRQASRVDVSMKSLDPKERNKIVRFLIDDVAFIEGGCSEDDAAAGITPTAEATGS